MQDLMPPEDTGEQTAGVLLGEIEQGGVVDSTHQVVLKTCTFDHCCSMNFWLFYYGCHSSRALANGEFLNVDVIESVDQIAC